jgi:methionine-rich copper-binding protein CopC
LIAGVLLALAIGGPALAHADLVTSNPGDKAVLATPPPTITLTFSEALDASKSSFKVLLGDTLIGTGKASGAMVMTLDSLTLVPGVYEVRWTSAATDGHIQRGKFTFTIAEPTPAPPTPSATPPALTAAPSSAPSAAPTIVPTAAPTSGPATTPAPSGTGTAPAAASTSDVLVPIVVGLIVVAGIGALLLRRSRGA